MQNRPAFEVPYSEISNTNLAGKNEVAVEFALSGAEAAAAKGQSAGSTENRGRKAAVGPDELVEMRFYIPGTASKKNQDDANADGEENGEEDAEEQNAANLFYETLMDKAEIGDVAGDTFATFLDVLHLTPRLVTFPGGSGLRADLIIVVVSISTCTNRPSVSGVKHTTTRSNTLPSRNSSYSPSPTRHTLLSFLVWTLHCARVRHDTPSSLCNLRSMKRSALSST